MKQKVTISLDMDNPTEAMVYEYLQKQGRKKTRTVVALIDEKIESENKLMSMKRDIAVELLRDSNFIESLSKRLEIESKQEIKANIITNETKQESEIENINLLPEDVLDDICKFGSM